MSKITALRGMKDLLPDESWKWQYVENTIKQIMHTYAYKEIRTPLLEATGLFARGIGDSTDIVNKEMYTFSDKGDDSITLRPEGTAGVARAVIENNLTYNAPQKLFYIGSMFRYERPQKGRYRQFHQLGVEVLGLDSPAYDAEIIFLSRKLWQELGIEDALQLELNSLGSAQERANFRAAIYDYLYRYKDDLDEDSKARLETNPLRILDSKEQKTQEILTQAPFTFSDFLGDNSKADFDKVCETLQLSGLKFVLNPKLVRGLDYYNKTVFEWTTDKLGSQNAVLGGGRYDTLLELLGGKPTPAVGFAMGMERLILLLETLDKFKQEGSKKIILLADENYSAQAMQLAENLRNKAQAKYSLDIILGGSLKSQLKKADKYLADAVLIYAQQEVERGEVSCKFLRKDIEQVSLKLTDIENYLTQHFGE